MAFHDKSFVDSDVFDVETVRIHLEIMLRIRDSILNSSTDGLRRFLVEECKNGKRMAHFLAAHQIRDKTDLTWRLAMIFY